MSEPNQSSAEDATDRPDPLSPDSEHAHSGRPEDDAAPLASQADDVPPGADDDFEDDDQDEPKKAGCLKVGCLTILSMLLVTALAVGGFAAYLNWKLDHNIKKTGLLPTEADQPTRNAAAGDALNILLLGSDSRSQSLQDASRSDVIQLVHVSNDRKSVQVIHFPRDLYVSIPGRGKNKINAAYAYGGPQLLIRTLQDLLGIKIDHAAQIGFDGFAKLTDTVGGVDLYVPQAYTDGSKKRWEVGMQHMNGKQALGFVRERYQLREGDIDRGRNQQAWIKAIMAKTLKAGTLLNPIKLNSIVDDLTSNDNLAVDKDMNVQSLGWSMRNLRMGNVRFYTAPFSGYGNDPVAGAIDIVDEPKMKALGQALYNDDFSKYTGTSNPLR